MMLSLHGKRAMVTGASSGLGAHFARVLADAGAELILAARRIDALEPLAGALGPQTRIVSLDVRDPGSVAAAFETAGSIDVLVNNAGVTSSGPALDQSEDNWASVVGTNLEGSYRVALAGARMMRAAGRAGSIVNIASILGLRQGGQVTPYAISKAGMIQMTKQLALELARFDIRVNAIAPGYFRTDLNRDFFESPAGEALVRRVPQRRLGRLEELDGPLLLLAGDASSFMTGSVIVVDGGHMVSAL